jgi:hypothetical protein
MSENLIQHKLDLNDDGDFDFNKRSNRMYQAMRRGAPSTKDSKEVKFSQQSDAQSSESETKNFNKNNNNNNGEHSRSRTKLTQFAKSVFSRKNNSEKLLDSSVASSTGNETNSKLKEKLLRTSSNSSGENTNKYIEMQDISLDLSRNANVETVKGKSPNVSDRETEGGNGTNRWSMTNESIKGFDSENEEIPLVTSKKSTNHQKKKSGHSIITVIPNTAGSVSSTASKSNVNPSVGAKSKQAKLITEHQDSAVSKKHSTSSSTATTSKTSEMGAENEGFNETNF